ncbi:hypothetical protein ACFUOZ_09680 [Paenarthrobacter sp. NPDC057355]|uniref:hypothetical protein n=1 Tax=Paenarthrobacter sp. NPDC057355 TaxID=3346105 RepID=UPI0036272DCB
MGTLKDDVKAIDDRVRAANDELNAQDKLNLGDRLLNEFEGIWESLHLVAEKVTELEEAAKVRD